MDIVIEKITRNYLKENINSFVNILKNEKHEYWRDKQFLLELPMKFEFSIMALLKSQLIGYIIASQKENIAYIHKFMVAREYRGHGVGSLLQKEFEKNILQKNITIINLSVYSENEKGIYFYLKNNYIKYNTKNDNLGNSILIMKKDISL